MIRIYSLFSFLHLLLDVLCVLDAALEKKCKFQSALMLFLRLLSTIIRTDKKGKPACASFQEWGVRHVAIFPWKSTGTDKEHICRYRCCCFMFPELVAANTDFLFLISLLTLRLLTVCVCSRSRPYTTFLSFRGTPSASLLLAWTHVLQINFKRSNVAQVKGGDRSPALSLYHTSPVETLKSSDCAWLSFVFQKTEKVFF